MREGSYNTIEREMRVLGPGGEDAGKVDQVLYDEASDIFVGLVIHDGRMFMDRHLFVPGENVLAVHRGHVEIDLPVSALEPYVSPAERHAVTEMQYEEPGPADDILV